MRLQDQRMLCDMFFSCSQCKQCEWWTQWKHLSSVNSAVLPPSMMVLFWKWTLNQFQGHEDMRSLYSSSKISKLLHSSSFYLQKIRIEFTIFAKWLNWKSDYNSDQREIWSFPTVLSSLYFWTNVLDISFEYFRPKGIPIKDLNSGQKAFTFQRIIAFELISANLASIGWALLVLDPFTNHSDGHLNMNCSATEASLRQSENTKVSQENLVH